MSRPLSFCLALILLLSACQEKDPERPQKLEKAFSIHLEAVKVGHAVKDLQLEAQLDSSFFQQDAEFWSIISPAIKLWEEKLAEVPGYEEHIHEATALMKTYSKPSLNHHGISLMDDMPADEIVAVHQKQKEEIKDLLAGIVIYQAKYAEEGNALEAK